MSKRFFQFLSASTIFLTLLSYGYQEEKMNYYIPLKVSKPPVIDGHLSEDFWEKAKKVSGFIRTDGKKVTQQTTVMVCYDENNLYFGIEAQESNINQIRRSITIHGDPVWEDDSIEIFIAPDYLRKWSYYHFVANTLSTKYEKGINTENPFGLFWQVQANVKRNRWAMEISIPFSTLGIVKGKKKNLFGVSVCRERWAGKPEFSCWNVGGWFHKPDGHFLFTTYKEYVRKEILPFWKKEKEEILKIVKEYKGKNKRKVNKIKEIILQIEKENKDFFEKEITSERINSFIEDLTNSIKEIEEIKEDIKFTISIKRLKNLVK